MCKQQHQIMESRKEHWRTVGHFKRCNLPIIEMCGEEKDYKKEYIIEDWSWPRTFQNKVRKNCRRRSPGNTRWHKYPSKQIKIPNSKAQQPTLHTVFTLKKARQKNLEQAVTRQRLWGIVLTIHMTGGRSIEYEQNYSSEWSCEVSPGRSGRRPSLALHAKGLETLLE